MSEYKVGDKVRVTKSLFLDEINGIEEGGIYEVVELVDYTEAVNVNTHIRKNYGLIYSQIEKVEEEKQMSEFKVGDKVRVLRDNPCGANVLSGEIREIVTVENQGSICLNTPYSGWVCGTDIELVEEEKQVNEFKVGDKVRVNWVDEEDKRKGISKGDCFNVLRVDRDGDIRVALPNGEKGVLFKRQLEKVENKTEFTFPQMAQKLIDGEFEIGTELVTSDDSTYFVDRAGYKRTYGLKSSKNGGLVVSEIGASDFNATWKVKEQPIKEMSIEEIQKELGYKIKVTE